MARLLWQLEAQPPSPPRRPRSSPELLPRCESPSPSLEIRASGGRGCLRKLAHRVGLVLTFAQAAQSVGHRCWRSHLAVSPPLPCTFPLLRADSQALSQVRGHPGHRSTERFLGTQLPGKCFPREESVKDKAASNHPAGSENEPLSALAQLWTRPHNWSTGQPGKVLSCGGTVYHTKGKMQKNKH